MVELWLTRMTRYLKGFCQDFTHVGLSAYKPIQAVSFRHIVTVEHAVTAAIHT